MKKKTKQPTAVSCNRPQKTAVNSNNHTKQVATVSNNITQRKPTKQLVRNSSNIVMNQQNRRNNNIVAEGESIGVGNSGKKGNIALVDKQ